MILGASILQGGVLIDGALTGLGYGLLAVGLILVYRATRVINFAHTQIGALAALVMGKLMLDDGWSYAPALLVAVAAGLVLGVLLELLVIRPLFDRPRLILLVGTLGASQVLGAAQDLFPSINHPALFPSALSASIAVGSSSINGADLALLVATPIVAGALALWLSRSAYGLGLRATAENAAAARLAGIPIRRISLTVFTLSGGLAALTIVLLDPARGIIAGNSIETLGPALLLRALVAALIGRFRSVPRALAGGVVLGMIESELYAHVSNPGAVDGYVFLILLVVVAFVARTGDTDFGSWKLAPTIAPIPRRLVANPTVRAIRRSAVMVPLALVVLLPMVLTAPTAQLTLAEIVVYAMIGASATIVTGWSAQLSLALYAFAGLGAFVAARLVAHGIGFVPALAITAVIGGAVAAVVGIPALRIKGVYLAVVTLGFAVAVEGWLLPSGLLSAGQSLIYLPPGHLGGINLANERDFFWFCAALLALVVVLVAHLRQTGPGRAVLAVRDNEQTAAAFGIWPAATKVKAFAFSGGIAALAGGLLGALLINFSPDDFTADQSLTILTMIVIGGVGSLTGSIVGAIGIIGIPVLLGTYINSLSNDVQSLQLILSGLAVIQVLSKSPGGIAESLLKLRTRLLYRAAGEPMSSDEPAPPTQTSAPAPLASLARMNGRLEMGSEPALRVTDLCVGFGGITANRDVELELAPGEIVGLIGANGAGKTTLMNAISGFVPISSGRVELFGHDVTRMAPHMRSRMGMARCFQGARLFEGLTVAETLEVSLQGRNPIPMTGALLALPPVVEEGRRRAARVDELAAASGLVRYLDLPIEALSTGTRRIVELVAALARNPGLIMLDEPTAGVAQREVEAFGPLIRELRDVSGVAILIIEHDLPLVMSVSDRIVALAQGAVICDGPPAVVREHPEVIASYLGEDTRAIQRSAQSTASPRPVERQR